MITYRKATLTDQAEIIALLSESFLAYDYYKIYVTDEQKRIEFVKIIQELCVKTSFKKDYPILVATIEQKIVATAILIPPFAAKVTIFDYLLAGGLKLLPYGGIKNTLGFLTMMKEANAVCQQTYPQAWFLEPFAVSNQHQGQGIGRKMLNDWVKPYIAKHGGGILTFITNSESNRRFYQKNGFSEFHCGEIRRNHKTLGNWSYKAVLQPEK